MAQMCATTERQPSRPAAIRCGTVSAWSNAIVLSKEPFAMRRDGQNLWIIVRCAFALAVAGCSSGEPAGPEPTNTAGTPTTPGDAGRSAPSGDAGKSSDAKPSGQSGAGAKAEAGASAAGNGGGPDPNVTILRSSVQADESPELSAEDYKAFIAHINKFGLDLGRKLVEAENFEQLNVIYSPLSATVALAMTYAGARGTTATEMKSVLGDTFAVGQFHVAANRLTRELASRRTSRMVNDKTRKVELNVVDSLWVERTLEVEGAFLDLLSREYNSGVRQVDFVTAFEPARLSINDWVSDQTKMRIEDLIPPGAIDAATRVVLVNAVYFYGSWASPFTHEATSPATFKPLAGATIQVPTMHQVVFTNYRSSDDYALAELPYELDKLRMTIVLPAEGKFEAVRSQVSSAWLEQAVAGITPAKVSIALPKFKMTVGTFSLTESLRALGMNVPFTNAADFSGITQGGALQISDVVQKAFIAVDEDGTEAAAATAVIVSGTSAPIDQPIPFLVDRPFLFFIRDDNGAVLFSGQVTDPTK